MKKLQYIEGLKGIGALLVYFCHYVFAFYYGAYSLQPEHTHTAAGLEIAIGRSPLNLFYNGNFAVELFLVLSGFVLCLGYFRTGDKKRLYEGARKRYFRLMVPILAVNTLIFVLMLMGLYQNSQAAGLTKSMDWFYGFNRFDAHFGNMVLESLAGCFLWGSNDYNGVLWTMPYLFLGPMLVYLTAALVGRRPFRYGVYALLIVASLFIRIYFAGIFFGFFVCDVVCTQEKLMDWYRRNPWLSWLCMGAGFYLASYPSIGTNMEGTIYALLGVPRVVPYHLAGASLILLGVVGNSFWQRLFGSKPLAFLGRISYSLYLIHFPIIATFSSWFFLEFREAFGYHGTVGLDFLVTSLLALLLAWLGNRYLEPLGSRLGDWIWNRKGRKK